MKSVYILLNSIDKVKNFVSTTTHIEGDLDLVVGRYVVDAKSIMGIFSLDLRQPLRLDIHDDAQADSCLELLRPYLVDQNHT